MLFTSFSCCQMEFALGGSKNHVKTFEKLLKIMQWHADRAIKEAKLANESFELVKVAWISS